jgi:hypothetical protein
MNFQSIARTNSITDPKETLLPPFGAVSQLTPYKTFDKEYILVHVAALNDQLQGEVIFVLLWPSCLMDKELCYEQRSSLESQSD